MSDAAKELAQAQAAGLPPAHLGRAGISRQRFAKYMTPHPSSMFSEMSELLNRHLISIVGSRRPTPYGNQMAERLAEDLADRGW